nr:MAG TPA: hypothetical protein [Caudoviricetes sp.]
MLNFLTKQDDDLICFFVFNFFHNELAFFY